MNIVDKIKFEEGDKSRVYYCPAGELTIGAGINLEQQEMPQEVRDLWLSIIVQSNFDQLQDSLYDERMIVMRSLPGDVALVLQDMAYQMGVKGLFKFVKMLVAIEMGLYAIAANHLLDSKYARQTPERANRNAKLLRGCNKYVR